MTPDLFRELQVAAAFLALSDTPAADWDPIEVLDQLATHCAELLAVDAAAVLLAEGDGQGGIGLVAISDDRPRTVKLLRLHAEGGPCVDAYAAGAPVGVPDLHPHHRSTDALAQPDAFRSVHALPLRLRGRCIGVLGLFRRAPGPLPAADLALGQALAQAATSAVLHRQTLRDQQTHTGRLQAALESRVLIEQAKGVLAERHDWTVEVAFDRMRRHARNRGARLAEVARQVVAGELVLAPGPVSAATPRPTRSHSARSRPSAMA